MNPNPTNPTNTYHRAVTLVQAIAALSMILVLALGACTPASAEPTSDLPTGGLERVPETTIRRYCAAYPTHCNVPEPCPVPFTNEQGEVKGGCTPIDWVCCGPSMGGCVAVLLAGDCPGGTDLYWIDCEAGESAIDSEGNAIVLCHDQ